MSYFIYDAFQAISVHGQDAKNYLQGQLTNDVNKLSFDSPLQLTALCNQKGRIIALFFLYYVSDDNFILTLPKNLTEQAITALRKYAVFSKVSFDATDNYQLVFQQGNPLTSQAQNPPTLYQHCILSNDAIAHIQKDAHPISFEEVMYQNILQKLPLIDIFNSEKFLPAELNLDELKAVSYEKGCFMGQEIIARMKYRGNLKKSLYAISIKPKLEITDDLYDIHGKKVADIVNHSAIEDTNYVLGIFNNAITPESIELSNEGLIRILS
ncbi:YgfZ/GcvT domain-containing protein [Fangia hongkongensis]|uniref:CAF17-like 4Fe-4S cluster assembly/insertion protein YgfZ n=1 Tax=Fangia hongkongensis TaxID=270495 RepID=UPI00035E7A0C|nr:folate-binding protein YgfZ [Fangia hongkongensis]MBK2124159.1 folate-binding protein YgfZ [Fangia hongkongensis]